MIAMNVWIVRPTACYQLAAAAALKKISLRMAQLSLDAPIFNLDPRQARFLSIDVDLHWLCADPDSQSFVITDLDPVRIQDNNNPQIDFNTS